MIMVTGASGALGSRIVAALSEAGREVVAGTRRPGEAATGVPARRVDFDRPGELSEAFAGVEVLVLVSAGYAEDDVVVSRHEGAIAAAIEAGVRHVAYTSLAGAGDHLSIALAHRATERALATSGLEWTVLRNGLYAELIAPSAATAAASGVLDAPMGEGSLAVVARADLAEAAALVASEPEAHAGHVYELVGDRALSGADIAAAVGARYEQVSLEAFREALTGAGLPSYQVAHSVSIYANIAAGFLGGTESDLPRLLGREPRSALDIVTGAA
ncbi:NAD(P)H-binding protein [Glycomyces paridis]|uniref:NAD-dependent epimerase/dehydratase family protein n=1 Tax=Glycomyces paridis TaxID=2126555 RepID=A0A4S8P5L3_9ACTN|nr:NAD(P)H-binding protein [Glycomyces paridis]THV24252.1 NAD-dependent epimerase/dehydratase family protein [Glycomyces paridis]